MALRTESQTMTAALDVPVPAHPGYARMPSRERIADLEEKAEGRRPRLRLREE